MDILGSLPVELSIRILKYLTPAGSILLRLVSKSYHNLLTSEEVCSSLSHHFIKREYNAAKKLDSWRLHYENHVSRRLAYGSGKPWAIEPLYPMFHRSFCPETGYFAGVLEAKRHTVQVLDLNTYPAEYVFPPTRTLDSSEIRRLVLLPSFVVVATMTNRGYSWNLETHKVYQFEVPDSGYYSAPIYGSGNLIIIALWDLVIVHDVQAEKASSFKGIGDYTRIWNGVETLCDGVHFATANSEKRVVWMIRDLYCDDLPDQVPFTIDSLDLETGEFVLGGICNIAKCHAFYCGDGLWQFRGAKPVRCHPGSAEDTTNAQAERFIFDTGTGAWTEEPYTIMFPGGLPEFDSRTRYSRPVTRPDGLGCFTESHPHSGVWMLDQEPGGRVTRARPLALNDFHPTKGGSIYCLGICDRFVLLRKDGLNETAVVRFKGIHDSDRASFPLGPTLLDMNSK